MAQVYGDVGAESELIKRCNDKSINNFEDVDILLNKLEEELVSQKKIFDIQFLELKDKLAKKEKIFFEKLPSRIKNNKKQLVLIKAEEKDIRDYWNKKIKDKRKDIDDNKKTIWNKKRFNLIFSLMINYIRLKKTKMNKLKALEPFQDKIQEKSQEIEKLEKQPENILANEESDLINKILIIKENPEEAFKAEQKELIQAIETFHEIKGYPEYIGARGELIVLKELEKLNDDYHIMCDLNIELDKYCCYENEWNLKSAQMDFVVVCYKGIFIIEVKNWSSSYLNKHSGLSPYEQVDRAGRVLYKHLNEYLPRDVALQRRLTKILLPIQNNMNYNQIYKTVMVRNSHNLNSFMQNKRDVLSEYEVDNVISLLTEE